MTDQSIGDYYANKEREAREISALLEHAHTWRRHVAAAINDGIYGTAQLAKQMEEGIRTDIRRLARGLERARYVGD